MPKEIPGFYYDEAKNRYFPYKGPIPGSSRKPLSLPPPPKPSLVPWADGLHHAITASQEKLLRARELCGSHVISSRRGKLNLETEIRKRHVTQPGVWKYRGTKKMANIALEHAVADVIMPDGQMKRDILLSGGANGLLCLFQVGEAHKDIDATQIYNTDHAWPLNVDKIPRHEGLLKPLGSSYGAMTYMTSDVSCIKLLGSSTPTDAASSRHFVITTMGSHSAPGCIYLLDLSRPLDFNGSIPMARGGFFELASFNQTLWTADCDPKGRHAVIGTNRGVSLVDIETGAPSRVLRTKSDVLSLQLDQSGKFMLAGLRNGAIMTVDTRQRQITGSTCPTITMPSSVCCLTSLKCWDQYFLASSMDGSIRLYDHCMLQKGPVQSYQGTVNSHTRIQLGVDPSEKILMSGGEDCYTCLWDVKSGELLIRDRFMRSIPSSVCWPRIADGQGSSRYWQDHNLGVWFGSYEGIFYMDWF